MINNTWNKFQNIFPIMIENNEKYNIILKNIQLSPNNILLYCSKGFPIDLFIECILMKFFNKKAFYRSQHIWNKSIHYYENQDFIEIDLMNPENSKYIEKISEFLLHIVNTRHINNSKHYVVLKHIDLLSRHFYEFRILLERFLDNIIFLSCTHKLAKIELPIKSRYSSFRIPLFTHKEINDIFVNYLDMSLNDNYAITESRDIIKAIFISEIECQPNSEELLTDNFIIFNYPPIVDFIKNFNKKNVDEIRNLSYKCCQYNISVLSITLDFVKLIDYNDEYLSIKYGKIAKKNYATYKTILKQEVIRIGSEIDYLLSQTNKCKEPIYIESLLCKFLL